MNLSPHQIQLFRDEIHAAKQAATAVLEFARRHSDGPAHLGDIAGASQDQLLSYARYAIAKVAGVKALRTHAGPVFFSRIFAVSTIGDAVSMNQFLFSKARFPGSVALDDDQTVVLSWTSPLYVQIRGGRPGSLIELDGPHGAVRHAIKTSSDWRSLLPTAEGIVLRGTNPNEDLKLESEHELAGLEMMLVKPAGPELAPLATSAAVIPDRTDVQASDASAEIVSNPKATTAPPESRAANAREFGLGEIIALADTTQRSAMHLPFGDDVLVDGPPGSGKTSVGLMRIPCLIDRQWHELNRTHGVDRPFHENASMRVLVMNPEMVPYLQRLMQEVGIQEVPTGTLDDFCRTVLTKSSIQTLGGVLRACSPELDRLKRSRSGFRAFAGATTRSVVRHWQTHSTKLRQRLMEVHEAAGSFLADRILGSWVRALPRWEIDPTVVDRELCICQRINDWARLEMNPPPRASRPSGTPSIPSPPTRKQVRRLVSASESFIRNALDSRSILAELVVQDDLPVGLLEEWRRQASPIRNQAPTHSAADVALHGLATSLFLLSHSIPDEQVLIGGRRPRLTHALIDEAQDISPIHVHLLRNLLDQEGTLTMVGDLRQRVDPVQCFEDWSELPLRNPQRATFTVNHRQTAPVGEFVRSEFERLYSQQARWKPSDRPGPEVRAYETPAVAVMETVVREIRHWFADVPNAFCGVLFVEDLSPEALRAAHSFVERELRSSRVPVQMAVPGGGKRQLRGDAGVVLAPVSLTKGLEFDVVVVVSIHGPTTEMFKNRHYVGCSRARHALSVITTAACWLEPTLLSIRTVDQSTIVHRFGERLRDWFSR